MNDQLDALLSQPLRDVPDNGFTNRIAAQMELARLRRDRLVTDICAGLVLFAVLILPFTGLGQMLAASASTVVGMVMLCVISFAAVATISVRKFSL